MTPGTFYPCMSWMNDNVWKWTVRPDLADLEKCVTFVLQMITLL